MIKVKRILCSALFLVILSFTFSCESKEKYIETTFFAMDSVINIKIAEDEYDEAAMLSECEKIVKNIESII